MRARRLTSLSVALFLTACLTLTSCQSPLSRIPLDVSIAPATDTSHDRLSSDIPAHSSRGLFGNDRGADAYAPFAVVYGTRLSKGALADFWFERYPEEYARAAQSYVDRVIVAREVNRLKVRVLGPALDKAVAAEVAARRKQLSALYGEKVRLEDEVRRAYGTDLRVWTRTLLRRRIFERMLMERVVRLSTRSAERIHVRVIVARTEADAQRVIAKVRRGADFSLTALKESSDPTAKVGGDLPPIARGDLAFPGVETKLFAAPVGAVVGPLRVTVDGALQIHIYKVIQRHPAWSVASDVHARLESDLKDRPVRPAEVERWRGRMHREAGLSFLRPDGTPWIRAR